MSAVDIYSYLPTPTFKHPPDQFKFPLHIAPTNYPKPKHRLKSPNPLINVKLQIYPPKPHQSLPTEPLSHTAGYDARIGAAFI
jgi:hypothetical protein